MTLRILVVSDVRVVQQGLRSILAQHQGRVDVVGAVDILHAKDQTERLSPDVVLFDAARQDCLDFLKDLVAAAPHSKVVAFGVREKGEELLALAAAGTAGYVCNSADCGDVIRVLQGVMCDELPCSPRAAASLYRGVALLSPRSNEVADVVDPHETCAVPLTRRELEIAHLVDRGLTNKAIAFELGIEAATVKNHIHHICEKLNVHRRGEAIARIRAMSWTQSPSLGQTTTGPGIPGALYEAGPGTPQLYTEPALKTTSLPANVVGSRANGETSLPGPRPPGAKILR